MSLIEHAAPASEVLSLEFPDQGFDLLDCFCGTRLYIDVYVNWLTLESFEQGAQKREPTTVTLFEGIEAFIEVKPDFLLKCWKILKVVVTDSLVSILGAAHALKGRIVSDDHLAIF